MNGATAAASSSQRRIGCTSQHDWSPRTPSILAKRLPESVPYQGRNTLRASSAPPSIPMISLRCSRPPNAQRPYTERASASSASISHAPWAVSRRCRPSRCQRSSVTGRSEACASGSAAPRTAIPPSSRGAGVRAARDPAAARDPRRAPRARALRRACRRGSTRPPPRARRPAPRRPSARAEARAEGSGNGRPRTASAPAIPSSGSCMAGTLGGTSGAPAAASSAAARRRARRGEQQGDQAPSGDDRRRDPQRRDDAVDEALRRGEGARPAEHRGQHGHAEDAADLADRVVGPRRLPGLGGATTLSSAPAEGAKTSPIPAPAMTKAIACSPNVTAWWWWRRTTPARPPAAPGPRP